MPALRVATVARKSSSLGLLHDNLNRELANRLGLSFLPVRYRSSRDLLRGAARDEWDVASLPLNGDRGTHVGFTSPYVDVECAYLVAAAASIRSREDADQPHVRIAVITDSPAAQHLSWQLRYAQLRRVPSDTAAMQAVSRGEADAVAGFRDDLVRLAAQSEGYWVLMDSLFDVHFALAVPTEERRLLFEANDFVRSVKASGLRGEQIVRGGLTGVRVAEK